MTWESCSLREWLNGTFLNNAFGTKEQTHILKTNVSAEKNPKYSTVPGESTTDKAFLLSINEINKYFSSNYNARRCILTAYAKANGAYTSSGYMKDGTSTCCWWLRSPGNIQNCVAIVNIDGSVNYYGMYANYDVFCVRPAMWIDLGD